MSEWDTTEARPRKFYRTSAEGIAMARELQTEWETLGGALRRLETPEGDPE